MIDLPNQRGREASKAGDEPSPPMVYVLDDEDAVRRSLAVLLRSARIAVETYPDPMAFLDAMPRTDTRRGCVVTDLRMPEMDGMELLRQVRGHGLTLPVVVMTGHGDVALAVRAMKAGALDLSKNPSTPKRSSGPSRRL